MNRPDVEPKLLSLNRLRRLLGRWEARDLAPLISLAVLVIFFWWTVPGFIRPERLEHVLKQGAVLAMVATGLTYVLLCAEIDLSVGMMALWAACFCGWLFGSWEATAVGVAATIAIPLVSCLLLGMLTGWLTIRARLPSFIISLAMMFIAEGLSRWITHSESFKVPEILVIIGNRGVHLTERFTLPYSAIVAAAVMAAAHFVLRYTRFGRYVYASGGNRQAARMAGVRADWIVIACLAICALTAGLGGLINSGRMGNVTIDQNKDLLLSAVACVVLGGTSLFGGEGSMGKTVVGVFTFTILTMGLNLINEIDLGLFVILIDDFVRQLATGVVLMIALVINGVLANRK